MGTGVFQHRERTGLYSVRELNVAIELWGVAFCVVGIACVLLLARSDARFRNLLVAGFAMGLVSLGGDAAAGLYRGQEGALAWTLVHVGNYASFIGNFSLVAVITDYLCARIERAGGPAYRPWRIAVAISAGVMCVLVLVGVLFNIDGENVYHRTDWYWVGVAYVVAVGAANTGIAVRNGRELGAVTLGCLLFYTVAPTAASIAQVFVYGPNFVIVASVMALVVLFFEMQHHTSRALIERTEELAQSRVEVSESRIAIMVSQIQPHFLFNTLDTIYGLVDDDKEKAKEAIASFSRYLRANLDSLKHTEPVPIEREMEHVKTYLELERMSDEDRLVYDLDVQATGFKVPALSVQTLVENAVKHGLGERENGGRVIVRIREQVDEYTVAVIDDGVGCTAEKIENAEGVGLPNTRARLSAMCGGSLEVIGDPGVGTTVIMHVPKEGRRAD